MRKKGPNKQEFWIDGVTPIEVGIANEVAVEIVEEAMKRFMFRMRLWIRHSKSWGTGAFLMIQVQRLMVALWI